MAALGQKELLLYLFLVLVSDRNGISFYSYDSICTLLELSLDEYIASRNNLMDKDLIAFDGALFQVLDLPGKLPERRKIEVRSAVDKLVQQVVKGF
ncbi:MAG: helix-turn-helix domain-containing protein [Desulfobacterales bacterium]|nr:helix-turn-helix domain-containing protein [Desulfobacterales bacterium]